MFLLKRRNIKKVENKDSRFDLKTLVWIGFNYTCGMAFPLTFASLIYGSSSNEWVGLWIYLVLFLGSTLAGIMGYAYSKMAKVYIKSNGATYAYVRANFGRFLGWLIGAIQYISVPLAAASMILSMISINLESFVDWGKYENLYLNLIGIGIYLIAASSIFLGLKYFKIFINLSGIIKWFSSIFIIFCALALAGLDHFSGFEYAKDQTSHVAHKNFFLNFNNAFITMFYFYAGFETYTTITKNVMNPSKTMPRSILWITILALLFYVSVTILFMGVDPLKHGGPKWFSNNPALDISQISAGLLGGIFVISSMIALKLNAAMQNNLYSSGMLEPLAVEHYITPKFGRLNQDRVSIRASSFNIIVTTVFTLIIVCLPIFIADRGSNSNNNVDYSRLISFTSLVLLMQYFLVLLCVFKLYLKKKLLLKIWEISIFILAILFIVFEFIMYFVGQFMSIIQDNFNIDGIFSLVSLLFMVALFVIFILIYKFYYLPIYNRRMKDKPELQTKLENQFQISGYAQLEIDLFTDKKNTLKDLKQEFGVEMESISDEEHKKSILEFKQKKNVYINEWNINIKSIRAKYKSDIQQIKNPSDNYETISAIHNDYVEMLKEMEEKKLEELQYMKVNTIKKFSIKYNYINSKKQLIDNTYLQLEDYILNISDKE